MFEYPGISGSVGGGGCRRRAMVGRHVGIGKSWEEGEREVLISDIRVLLGAFVSGGVKRG